MGIKSNLEEKTLALEYTNLQRDLKNKTNLFELQTKPDFMHSQRTSSSPFWFHRKHLRKSSGRID